MRLDPPWELAADRRDALGEGPSWDPRTGTLLWVDIPGRSVQRLDPATGRVATLELDRMAGAVLPRAAGGLALCLEDGVYLADSDTGPRRRLAAIEADDESTRMNDAKVDRMGRLWAGTMARDARDGAGSLYRIDGDGTVRRVLAGVTISNGTAWSPDDRRMYYIDTATHRIDVFDFDIASGIAEARRPLVEIPPDAGLPDGMTVDSAGCLWVAFYDGWCVRRYTPDGELDRRIPLPVARVTSCAFGGPDLADLYATTASNGLTDAELGEQPLAGGLFVIRPGVTGLPEAPFAG